MQRLLLYQRPLVHQLSQVLLHVVHPMWQRPQGPHPLVHPLCDFLMHRLLTCLLQSPVMLQRLLVH